MAVSSILDIFSSCIGLELAMEKTHLVSLIFELQKCNLHIWNQESKPYHAARSNFYSEHVSDSKFWHFFTV